MELIVLNQKIPPLFWSINFSHRNNMTRMSKDYASVRFFEINFEINYPSLDTSRNHFVSGLRIKWRLATRNNRFVWPALVRGLIDRCHVYRLIGNFVRTRCVYHARRFRNGVSFDRPLFLPIVSNKRNSVNMQFSPKPRGYSAAE